MNLIENPDWNQLLSKAKAGDDKSKGELYSDLRNYLIKHTWSSMYGYSSAQKEDLIERAVLKATRDLNKINKNPQSYTFKVYENTFGDDLRKRYGTRRVKRSNFKEGEPQEYHQTRETHFDCLDEEPAGEPFYEKFEEKDFITVFRRAIRGLKRYCRMMFSALIEDRKHELLSIFMELNPGHSKSDFYVQTMRCRNEFKRVRKELEG